MRLYTEELSPNGKRVFMYAIESEISLNVISLDLSKKENKTESYLKKIHLALCQS